MKLLATQVGTRLFCEEQLSEYQALTYGRVGYLTYTPKNKNVLVWHGGLPEHSAYLPRVFSVFHDVLSQLDISSSKRQATQKVYPSAAQCHSTSCTKLQNCCWWSTATWIVRQPVEPH